MKCKHHCFQSKNEYTSMFVMSPQQVLVKLYVQLINIFINLHAINCFIGCSFTVRVRVPWNCLMLLQNVVFFKYVNTAMF